jgi:hypothetical protein
VHIIIQFLLLGFNVKAEQVASLEVMTEEAILSRTMYKIGQMSIEKEEKWECYSTHMWSGMKAFHCNF